VICPICSGSDALSFQQIQTKEYFRCNACMGIFVDPKNHLSPEEEKERYSQHNNDIYDFDYRKFLLTLYDPITQKLKRGARGLDYGSGPGPALAEMFKEDHYDIEIYDPYFFPDDSCFNKQYDFITCTEVAEHFYSPQKEFQKLNSLLEVGGWLGIMTNFYDDSIDFQDWYYRKDPTHVVFYAQETFEFIGSMMSWRIEIPTKNVVLFKK
jgi:hypothetical protein